MSPQVELDYNKLLDVVSEMGYRLMESGAEIYRVEESIHRLLEAYGLPRGEVFAIPNCIIVSLTSPEGQPLTQIRRMPPPRHRHLPAGEVQRPVPPAVPGQAPL